MHKEVKALCRRLTRLGLDFRFSGSGHLHILRADGKRLISMSSTPSSTDSVKAAIRDLRRAGVEV